MILVHIWTVFTSRQRTKDVVWTIGWMLIKKSDWLQIVNFLKGLMIWFRYLHENLVPTSDTWFWSAILVHLGFFLFWFLKIPKSDCERCERSQRTKKFPEVKDMPHWMTCLKRRWFFHSLILLPQWTHIPSHLCLPFAVCPSKIKKKNRNSNSKKIWLTVISSKMFHRKWMKSLMWIWRGEWLHFFQNIFRFHTPQPTPTRLEDRNEQ